MRTLPTLGLAVALALGGCAAELPALPYPSGESRCPPLVLPPSGFGGNDPSPVLGCISERNLRAMVADPADLRRGRPLGPANGERETRAVQAYEQGRIRPAAGAGALTPQVTMPGAGAGPAP